LEPYRDCCGYAVVWVLGEYFLGSTLGITFVGPCPHRDRDSLTFDPTFGSLPY